MENRDCCPHCGALVLPEEKFCRQCGTALTAAPATGIAWTPGRVPATIEELQDYCAYHHMPLEKMRFFVGVDYQEPRAFGIYREGDQCVVYKNKADGSRAVRYHGPDEKHAVGELYAKLLDECHMRDIWPDGGREEYLENKRKRARKSRNLMIVTIAIIAVVAIFLFVSYRRTHAHDGYYRFDDGGIYYLYGSDWYYDDYYHDWVERDPVYYDDYDDYADYYIGSAYDSDWGYSDFRKSDTWDDIQESSRTSSSDYDSWDSGGTDWSSDW